MFHRGNPPCFFAFDLLTCEGKDLRTERLLDRKQELRRLLARACAPLKYTEYIDGCGMALFQRICELDLEGVVAKQKYAPYVTEREQSTWFKILNREYSQMQGREELFERERHSEPVAGWHVCALVCEARSDSQIDQRQMSLSRLCTNDQCSERNRLFASTALKVSTSVALSI